MDTVRDLHRHRRIDPKSVLEVELSEFEAYAPERPARTLVTELHWYARRDGTMIGAVQRNHARQEFEYLIFAEDGGRYRVLSHGRGISDRSATCVQVVDAMREACSLAS